MEFAENFIFRLCRVFYFIDHVTDGGTLTSVDSSFKSMFTPIRLLFSLGDCKTRNETEMKRNETSRNETKRNETQQKRNEITIFLYTFMKNVT